MSPTKVRGKVAMSGWCPVHPASILHPHLDPPHRPACAPTAPTPPCRGTRRSVKRAAHRRTPEHRTGAECIVAKNRHGETGKVPLRWAPEYVTFSTLEMRYDEDD